jgi:glycosyltransferase involved in cell wall biosynthesis/protein-tyrosine-phosphatase
MRVCHIMSADLWAGAEVQVATTVSYLVARPDMHVSAVLLNEGRLADELRRLGVHVAVVDESRNSSLRILAFLVRFLRDHDFDLVHTHRNKDTVLGTLAAKLAGVPHVVRTVHGLREPLKAWQWAKYCAYDALDKAALWCFADRIIAVSWNMAEILGRSGYKPAAITPIHNGLDLRRVKPARSRDAVRRELGVDPGALLIGTVGRLSPVKGHADLLRAARLILEREPAARFLIVGGGPLHDELVALAAELGIERECIFAGPRADVYDLMAALDIFVLPSLDEGIPMAVLEAMALGRPVVATRVGGLPEIIREGETGLLVTPRRERELAEACLELASHPDRARAFGARARRVVEEEFSHETNGQALVGMYRDVIGPEDRRVASAPPSAWRLALGLLVHAGRTVRAAMERQRMNWIRRHPVALRSALSSARSILIVCHGNIIRSPFAARLVAQGLGARPHVTVASAGLEAISGRPPHETAVLTATSLAVDLSGHRASPLTPERVAASDVIFAMDIGQLLSMRRRFPDAAVKTFLLTCLAPDAAMEIGDPVDGDESVFRACYDHISVAVRPIVGVLTTATGRA